MYAYNPEIDDVFMIMFSIFYLSKFKKKFDNDETNKYDWFFLVLVLIALLLFLAFFFLRPFTLVEKKILGARNTMSYT